MTPKLSIIIPVYNSEPYLRECLNSITNQTLKDIEIIIINDCSPDNSETIILEYMSKDPRICYIKNEFNLGTLASRKKAYLIAKGEYIQSLDSDDELELYACETIYNALKKEDADIYHLGVNIYIHPDKTKPKFWSDRDTHMFTPKKLTLTHSEWIECIVSGELDNCFWSYIIKKELVLQMLSSLKFEYKIVLLEDYYQIFTLALNYPVNKVISLDQILYHYRSDVGVSVSPTPTIDVFCNKLINVVFVLSTISSASTTSPFITEAQIQKLNEYTLIIMKYYLIDFIGFDKLSQQKVLSTLQDNKLLPYFVSLLLVHMKNSNNTEEKPIDTTTEMEEKITDTEKKYLNLLRVFEKIVNKIMPHGSFLRKVSVKLAKLVFKILRKFYHIIKK